jgi:hypothetical protein
MSMRAGQGDEADSSGDETVGTPATAARLSGPLSAVIAIACGTAALAFALYRVRFFMFESIDEGFYLATSMRYSLGDLPFRDEFFNPGRMFDIVLSPIFAAFPEIPVLTLRVLLVLFQIAALLPLFRLFSRWAPIGLVALACASTIWIPNIIWTPGYHVLGGSFFALAWGLWLEGCLSHGSRRAAWLGAFSGAAFFLCAMCYLPLVVVAAIPALVLSEALWRKRSEDHRIVASISHFLVLGVLSLVLVGSFAWLGLLGDWLDAFRTIKGIGPYDMSPSQTLGTYLSQLSRYLPVMAGGAAIGASLHLVLRAWARWSGQRAVLDWSVSVLLAIASYFAARWLFFGFAIPPEINFVGEIYTRPMRVAVLLWGIYLGLAATRRAGKTGEPAEPTSARAFAVGTTFAGASIAAVLFGLMAGMSFKSFLGVPPLAISVTAALYAALESAWGGSRSRPMAAPIVAALCISIAFVAYASRRPAFPRVDLLAPFTHPRFEGILEHRTRVQEWQELIAYLAERIEEGDFLLAYDSIPLLYFATRTRPALDHAWTGGGIPVPILRRSLRRMVERDRIPRYAVHATRMMRRVQTDPIHRFVKDRYTLETRFRQYEVWRLRDPE